MPKTIITLLLLLSIGGSLLSQQLTPKDQLALKIPQDATSTTDGISAYIKNNFQSDSERIRAIFVWVANNINYDIDLLLSKINPTGRQPVEEVLKTRKAVCGGYADLFTELCNKCNIPSIVITGFVKQKGAIPRISHAWSAVEFNHAWFLFDPTWAAGYINDDKFTKRFSETYYKVLPAEMITDHMPFDPMYQFMNNTFTNRDFIDGKTTASNKKPFNFADSLRRYNSSTKDEQVMQEMQRLEKNGIDNDIINDRMKYLSRSTESYGSKNGFNQAMELYNQAISVFNEYLQHKNKQFTTVKTDKELAHILDSASYYANASWLTLGTVVARSDANRQTLSQTFKSINQFQNKVNSEKNFIDSYIATEKPSRDKLFFKRQ